VGLIRWAQMGSIKESKILFAVMIVATIGMIPAITQDASANSQIQSIDLFTGPVSANCNQTADSGTPTQTCNEIHASAIGGNRDGTVNYISGGNNAMIDVVEASTLFQASSGTGTVGTFVLDYDDLAGAEKVWSGATDIVISYNFADQPHGVNVKVTDMDGSVFSNIYTVAAVFAGPVDRLLPIASLTQDVAGGTAGLDLGAIAEIEVTWNVDEGDGQNPALDLDIDLIRVDGNVCGDTEVDPGEECDDGNASNTDACLNTCEFNVCQDGFPGGPGEQCDDGNDVNGDGCDEFCQNEMIGGTDLPIDSVSLLVYGVQANSAWMGLMVAIAAGAGIAIFTVTKKIQKTL